MEPIPQPEGTLIREGEPSNPRLDKDVKPNSADAGVGANPDAPSKPKDVSKPPETKRKEAKQKPKGSTAMKDKKKKKRHIEISDSSNLSSTSSDDDATGLGSDSDTEDEDVAVRRKRTHKKREEAPKPKTMGETKKHKASLKSKLKPAVASSSDSDSESDSDSSQLSSSDEQHDSPPPRLHKKKTKTQALKLEVGVQVARELQRLLQLAQAQPHPPAFNSHAALGSNLDAGLVPGLLPDSGSTFPRTAMVGGLQGSSAFSTGGRAPPILSERVGLFDNLGDPLGRGAAIPGLRPMGARGRLPSDAAAPQKKPKKLDFKRVDQVWDNSIHNFKLQDTAESAADKKYDGFCFHVRRTFDWEGKYKATVVDVKSKALRACLQDVIGNIKGISLVDETPKLDPNVLFLYLEDLRKHAKQLKKLVKNPSGSDKQERKKEAKWVEEKRLHLKVLVKYIDKDYEHIKKSLYPMLEHGLITFDLLWALWKPGTLAYTTTYGSHDEPRVFKVDTAEKHCHLTKGEFYIVDGKVSAVLGLPRFDC
jgi:hypothetical protein